jgi:hypothetical protein
LGSQSPDGRRDGQAQAPHLMEPLHASAADSMKASEYRVALFTRRIGQEARHLF